jgi:RNA polymerase sigma factor for flagellar operon FliA
MDKKTRDHLIMKYAPLVKIVVGRITSRLPLNVADREDLVHVGIIGLMSALEKFDKNRNVQFETYARFRIRGAVLDELRERDWVPRSIRSKDSKLEEAFAALKKSLKRVPDDLEVARYLNVSLDEYFKMLDDARYISIISSEDLPTEYLETVDHYEMLEAVEQGNALEQMAKGETRDLLKKAIENLPGKERMVLTLYYYEELNMKEIGKVLELTESRVCQLHSQAILRLRGTMKDLR